MGRDSFVAGVNEYKASRAIGALDVADIEARLAECGRLLVASDAGDWDGAPKNFRIRFAVIRRTIANIRKTRARHPEHFQKRVVPLVFMDIEKAGAAGIGGVGGVRFAAGEAINQKTVDGAECDVACYSAFTRAFDIIQNPRSL